MFIIKGLEKKLQPV